MADENQEKTTEQNQATTGEQTAEVTPGDAPPSPRSGIKLSDILPGGNAMKAEVGPKKNDEE